MNTLDAWLDAGSVAGRSVLQLGALMPDGAAHAAAAARAGARAVALLDAAPPDHAAWAGAGAEVAAAGGALERLAGRDPLDAPDPSSGPWRLWDVVWCARVVFHHHDPVAVVRRCAALCAGEVVLRSTCVPALPGVLREGEAVCAMLDDPRLPAIRELLEARGVRLPQFEGTSPSASLPWGGTLRDGMWTWFFTVGALEDLLLAHGLEPVHRFGEWGDLGVSFVARKLRAPRLFHPDVRLPDHLRVGVGVAADPGPERVGPLGKDGVS